MDTYVDLKGHDSSGSVEYWSAKVHYNVWGEPYINGRFFGSLISYDKCRLFPAGQTSNTLFHVQWKHKSGPPVDFERQKEKGAW